MNKICMGIKNALVKMLIGIGKAIAKTVEKLGGEVEMIVAEVGKTVEETVYNLGEMTIAELRVLAKQLNISLEGKRIKQEIIEVIEKHTKGE